MSLKVTITGLELLARSIDAKAKKTARGVGGAVKDGATKIRDDGFKSSSAPFRRRARFRNVQDHRRRTRIRHRRSTVDARFDPSKNEALITAKPHTTPVTPVVKSVATQAGQRSRLRRRAIYVRPLTPRQALDRSRGLTTRSTRPHASRAGLKKISLRNPDIRRWADGKALDTKDTLRLRGEMLRLIVLKPPVDRHRDAILRDIRTQTLRGLR